MTQYKGYYIDHVYFNNKHEIDDFIKKGRINQIKKWHKLAFESGEKTQDYIFACIREMNILEKSLHDEYGMSWEEIEEIPYTA